MLADGSTRTGKNAGGRVESNPPIAIPHGLAGHREPSDELSASTGFNHQVAEAAPYASR